VRLALALCLLAVPVVARAQAEPAPAGYVPPGHEAPPPPPGPRNHIAATGRLGVVLGTRPPGLPAVGGGGGVQLSRALVDVGRMRLGVGFDFAYVRSESNGQLLANWTFAALAVLDGIFGRLRPWLSLGGGLGIGQYHVPAMSAMEPEINIVGALPLLQGALGLDVEVMDGVEVGFGGEIDLTFSSTTLGSPPRQPFAPGFFAARAGIGFRF